MTRLRRATRHTFRSLTTRNFRLYFFGQVVSGSGSWMQQVAQVWLVLELTGSGVALGITTALQFLPVLLGGAWAGLIADRADKRRLLVATNGAAGLLALLLGALTVTGVVQLWMVYGIAFLLGCVVALDSPARRSFVTEMVEPHHASNAVSLNSTVFTAARIIGPALAGAVIATVGLAWCFLVNAASFAVAIGSLLVMRTHELHLPEPVRRAKGQLREGFRYVWATPRLRRPLLMTAVIGTLSFNFQVTLSLLARKTFDGNAATFGALYALMSVGALGGALVVAHRTRVGSRFVTTSALTFGLLMLVAAAAPTLGAEMVALVGVGAAGIAFLSGAGAMSQTEADPAFRGRVAALFAVAFLGSTPIGGPIIGWISQAFGARVGLALGGVAAVVTALAVAHGMRRARRETDRPVTATPADERLRLSA